ncbi:hypothetical protein UFOVP138_55 [uncultured Caudovirales phage]|uniref:Uncharacterized protein n=1 Tax=uncultured Caudovirales phage TaxID=2100421 RepID=A0A6J5LC86_9CAUD|nr:hypothetical protein UFOVP138_55 [uncultured Caudovirales phage]
MGSNRSAPRQRIPSRKTRTENGRAKMTIIDTFFFLFESDAKALDKGLKDSEKGAITLAEKIKDTDGAAKSLGENFERTAKSMAGAVAGYFAAGALKSLIQDTADHTYETLQQARAMGVSTESLSAWQHAVQLSGGTAEGATHSFEGLREKFVEMSRFPGMMSGDVFMFHKLGLSAKDMHDSIKDPMIALGKLSETFGKLNTTQQLFVGKKLGFDYSTIAMLSKGRQGFDDMIAKQKELGVVTEQQALAAQRYKMAQMEVNIVLETLKRDIMSDVLPAFEWMSKKIEMATNYVRAHKEHIIGMVEGIAAGIAIFYLPAIASAVVATGLWVGELLLAAAPFIALGLAIGLVVDDFQTFERGGDSVIGKMEKNFPKAFAVMKASIIGLVNVLKELNAGLRFVGEFWTIGPSAAIKNYKEYGAKVQQDVKADYLPSIMDNAKQNIGMTNHPLSFMSSQSMMTQNQNSQRNVTVSIGDIAIQTDAKTAPDMFKFFNENIQHQVKMGLAHIDDGVAM